MLFADLTYPNGTKGVVYNDPTYSGIYFKVGAAGVGAWEFSAPLDSTNIFFDLNEDDAPDLAFIAMPSRRAGQSYKVSGAQFADMVNAKLGVADSATAGVAKSISVTAAGEIVQGNTFAVNACNHGVKATNTRAENSARLQEVADIVRAQPYGGRIILPAGNFSFDPVSQVQFEKSSGKYIKLEGEWGATTIDVGSSATPAFYVGSSDTPGGGTNFFCEGIKFTGGSSTAGRAFEFENANGAKFHRCHFGTMQRAITMDASYGVHVTGCEFVNVGSYNIFSSTHCHHLVIDKCDVYNAGVAGTGCVLFIDAGHTDNLVIRDSDFEFCRQIVKADDGLSAPIAEGNYIEYCTADPFDFGTGSYGISMSGNWLALGIAFTFHNWIGGEFSRNGRTIRPSGSLRIASTSISLITESQAPARSTQRPSCIPSRHF
ncbi:MAG: hypothetical protein JWM58_2324 [Rhizobium sp.]|nr:hypothetical protein [Rhizobium sp.]